MSDRISKHAKDGLGVLSVGQVSRELGIAPRTVARLIDEGILPGWRIPGMLDRRVSRSDLEVFARRNGIQLEPDRLTHRKEILLVGLPGEVVQGLQALPQVSDGLWGFTAAMSLFDAGWRFGREGYCALVMYSNRGAIADLVDQLGRPGSAQGVSLVALVPEDQSAIPPLAGAVATLQSPIRIEDLQAAILQATTPKPLKKGAIDE